MGRWQGSWARLSEKVSLKKAKWFGHSFTMLVVHHLPSSYARGKVGSRLAQGHSLFDKALSEVLPEHMAPLGIQYCALSLSGSN